MAFVRFYAVEPDCFFSRAVHFLGKLAGYDMQLVHCALEWDGFVNDFTIDGIGYYTVEEDEEHRESDIMVEIAIDHALLYERAMVLAYMDVRLNPWVLIKKMLRLPMRPQDLMCTDFVQLLIGDEPKHYSSVEFLRSLISDSIVGHQEDSFN